MNFLKISLKENLIGLQQFINVNLKQSVSSVYSLCASCCLTGSSETQKGITSYFNSAQNGVPK